MHGNPDHFIEKVSGSHDKNPWVKYSLVSRVGEEKYIGLNANHMDSGMDTFSELNVQEECYPFPKKF